MLNAPRCRNLSQQKERAPVLTPPPSYDLIIHSRGRDTKVVGAKPNGTGSVTVFAIQANFVTGPLATRICTFVHNRSSLVTLSSLSVPIFRFPLRAVCLPPGETLIIKTEN